MAWTDAFLPIEAEYRTRVLADTWGYPEPGIDYFGYMVFCQAESGDVVIIKSDFPDCPCGPFHYEDMLDFASRKSESGEIYMWRGVYRKFKNGGYRFSGKIEKINNREEMSE